MDKNFNRFFYVSIPPIVALVTSIGLLWWLFFPPKQLPINHFADSPPPPAANKSIPARKIDLEVWLDLDFTRDVSLFEEMADEFEQVYPQINVQISPFVRESMSQRIRQAVLTGGAPDVALGHVYSLAAQGLVEPLDQRVQAWNPAILDDFLPYALDEAKWHNTLYGLPVDVYTVILLYNRAHFDEAGLTYPTNNFNLFDLREAAKRLTNPQSGRYGVGLTTDAWYFHAWLTSAGTDLVSGDADKGYNLTLNAQNNVDVMNFLLQMIKDGYSPLPSSRPRDYEEARDLFIQQRLAIYFGELQDVHDIQAHYPNFPLGVAPLPRTPARESAASILGTSALFIPRGARNADAAFEFIKWASSDRYVNQMLRRTGRYPARKWMPTSPEVTKNLMLLPFITQLDQARPYRLDIFLEAEEAFVDAARMSFYQKANPAVALRRAQIIGQLSMRDALRWSPNN